MNLVQLTRVANLLSSSEYDDDKGVDVDDFGEGYDDEFGYRNSPLKKAEERSREIAAFFVQK